MLNYLNWNTFFSIQIWLITNSNLNQTVTMIITDFAVFSIHVAMDADWPALFLCNFFSKSIELLSNTRSMYKCYRQSVYWVMKTIAGHKEILFTTVIALSLWWMNVYYYDDLTSCQPIDFNASTVKWLAKCFH